MPSFFTKLSIQIRPTIRSAIFNTIPSNPFLKVKFLRVSSMAKPTEEEGTAKRFWDKFSKESVLTLYTPFLVSLASGNLKLDSFRHYVAQDVYFYKSFAQAYELAEDCADDDDAKVSIIELRKRVGHAIGKFSHRIPFYWLPLWVYRVTEN
ncbi:hypothetical protein M8C21_027460, partial [Ambrosia artemisiifolia]